MKLKFESDQQYQLDAISAITDLFEGQPLSKSESEVGLPLAGGQLLTEVGFRNALLLSDEALLSNTQMIQEINGLPKSEELAGCNFSIEMETGTGKTYVYLRTIHELRAKYGFLKFVIVVPNVAIREGVLQAIDLTQAHFSELYGAAPLDYWIYESKRPSSLRQFAASGHLQVLIINIDAFNKPDNNIIHRPQDRMGGKRPIEFIQAAMPIVILDEPQNMEQEAAREAIASLNPACTLRYSATHRDPYNLVYRLDPIRAYDLNLVKRIEVDAVREEPQFNVPFIEVVSVTSSGRAIRAKVKLDVERNGKVVRRQLTLRDGDDLVEKSGGRPIYEGYIVSELDAGREQVGFTNGAVLASGETLGGQTDEVMRFQISQTVREHLEKELRHQRLASEDPIKVLSLFFIDRVANYVGPEAKLRTFFEDAYRTLADEERYKELSMPPVAEVHAGYFAEVSGSAADTGGASKPDTAAYELIMRDKTRLLSPEEPVRFIFSHSALREGWDNPNVFQICTLNETRSEMRKRQEIGRGLRLPVRASGVRCFDTDINRLTVIANDSYHEFARDLQREIEQETGVSFEGRILNRRERRVVTLKKGWKLNEDFRLLWEKIRPRTRYRVELDSAELVELAVEDLRERREVQPPRFTINRAELDIAETGVEASLIATRVVADTTSFPIPDLVSHLQRETELTRKTIVEVLIQSGRLNEVSRNPHQFLDQALAALKAALMRLQVKGIKYEAIAGYQWEMRTFEEREIESYVSKLLEVSKSIYDSLPFDSGTEKVFAAELDAREDIRLFVKLPNWFKVETPLGSYNPDWAIVKIEDSGDERLYLVRETKSTDESLALRGSEAGKVRCGREHFNHLGVDFATARSAADI